MLRGGGPSSQFDRIAGVLAAVVVIRLTIFLLIRNESIADPKLFFVLQCDELVPPHWVVYTWDPQ
jgi:hypothetical protein